MTCPTNRVSAAFLYGYRRGYSDAQSRAEAFLRERGLDMREFHSRSEAIAAMFPEHTAATCDEGVCSYCRSFVGNEESTA